MSRKWRAVKIRESAARLVARGWIRFALAQLLTRDQARIDIEESLSAPASHQVTKTRG
jgi:hypothetical protein